MVSVKWFGLFVGVVAVAAVVVIVVSVAICDNRMQFSVFFVI